MTTVTKSKTNLFFTIASGLYIFIAFGHTMGFVKSMTQEKDLIGLAVWEGMSRYKPMTMSEHTLSDFYIGDSLYAGLASLALGLWGLAIVRYFKKQGLPVPRVFSALGAIFSVAGLVIAIMFFPAPPVAILALISLFFVLAMI